MILIYPGSFDPVTYGHADIALRGAKLASRLIISVLDNPNKKNLFSVEERLGFLREMVGNSGCTNIEVDSFSGLLAEYAYAKCANAILRGLRNSGDFEVEARYAAYNRVLSGNDQSSTGGIETIFIPASPSLSYISSSVVREAALHIYSGSFGHDALGAMVSPAVCAALKQKIKFIE